MKVNLVVSEPKIVGEKDIGVYQTILTHPKLDGQLSFVHGKNNREQTLAALTNSIQEDIDEIFKIMSEFTKGKK
jgi:hypothetical protein